MPLLARFFGNAASTGAGFAFGRASAPALSPAVEKIRQEAWETYPDRLPDTATLAEGVAQGQVADDVARAWAKKEGFDDAAFSAMVAIANVGPGMAQAFHLWRRRQINEAGFKRALKRLGIESEWINALWAVREEVLDPADLARAIHRGLIPDPGLLQGTLPSGAGNVPAYPVYGVDALAEAQAAGLDHDHLGVLVGLQGNPMGPHEAAEAEFRGNITHDDYLRAIAEGNTRNEWAQAIFEQSRQIPTARDFLENALRGYSNLTEAIAGAARHGMSREDATLIYQNQGRPMNVRQITQALARGAKFHPEPGELTDPYRASIVEGPVKPAYYEMAESLKYTLPGIFAMRALAESGVWDEAKTAERLKWAGWLPSDADEVARAWTAQGTTTSKGLTVTDLTAEYEGLTMTPAQYVAGLKELGYSQAAADAKVRVSDAKRARQARNQLINRARIRYTGWHISRQAASDALRAAGLTLTIANGLLTYWDAERDINVHTLTEAQVVKAYGSNLMDRPTATTRLTEIGLAPADIATRLDE